jgi:hypothetical protein
MQNILDIFSQQLAISLPDLAWAVVVLIFGIIIAKIIKKYVIVFLNKIRLNQVLKSLGWEDFFDRFDTKMNMPKFLGVVVEIYFFLLFLIMSFDILKLNGANKIIQGIVEYYPNIFVAGLIFIFAVFIADFSRKIVVGNLGKGKITYSSFLGDIIASGTWILAILAMLYQLQIVQTLILAIFIGVISLIVLTLGISFGLGGKDIANKILKDLEDQMK